MRRDRKGGREKDFRGEMGDAPRPFGPGFPPNSAGKFGIKRVGQVVIIQMAVLNVATLKLAQHISIQQVFVGIFHHRSLKSSQNIHQ